MSYNNRIDYSRKENYLEREEDASSMNFGISSVYLEEGHKEEYDYFDDDRVVSNTFSLTSRESSSSIYGGRQTSNTFSVNSSASSSYPRQSSGGYSRQSSGSYSRQISGGGYPRQISGGSSSAYPHRQISNSFSVKSGSSHGSIYPSVESIHSMDNDICNDDDEDNNISSPCSLDNEGGRIGSLTIGESCSPRIGTNSNNSINNNNSSSNSKSNHIDYIRNNHQNNNKNNNLVGLERARTDPTDVRAKQRRVSFRQLLDGNKIDDRSSTSSPIRMFQQKPSSSSLFLSNKQKKRRSPGRISNPSYETIYSRVPLSHAVDILASSFDDNNDDDERKKADSSIDDNDERTDGALPSFKMNGRVVVQKERSLDNDDDDDDDNGENFALERAITDPDFREKQRASFQQIDSENGSNSGTGITAIIRRNSSSFSLKKKKSKRPSYKDLYSIGDNNHNHSNNDDENDDDIEEGRESFPLIGTSSYSSDENFALETAITDPDFREKQRASFYQLDNSNNNNNASTTTTFVRRKSSYKSIYGSAAAAATDENEQDEDEISSVARLTTAEEENGDDDGDVEDPFDDVEAFLAKQLGITDRDNVSEADDAISAKETSAPRRKTRRESTVTTNTTGNNAKRVQSSRSEKRRTNTPPKSRFPGEDQNSSNFSSSSGSDKKKKRSQPGAYAISLSTAFNTQDDVEEVDHVNPDNYHQDNSSENNNSQGNTNGDALDNDSLHSYSLQNAAVRPVGRSGDMEDSSISSSVKSRESKVRIQIAIVIMTFLLVGAIAIGMEFLKRSRSNNSNNTMEPPKQVIDLNPSPTPPPTLVPTSSPTVIKEIFHEAFTFQLHDESVDSLGYTVDISGNLLVASNEDSVYTFNLSAAAILNTTNNITNSSSNAILNSMVVMEQVIDGQTVSLSNCDDIQQQTMVVKNGTDVNIYDYHYDDKDEEDINNTNVWEKIKTLSLDSTASVVSISGDGNTLLISEIINEKTLKTQSYRKEGTRWILYGKEIEKNEFRYNNKKTDKDIFNTISYDGSYIAFGVRKEGSQGNSQAVSANNDLSYAYKAPSRSNGRWDELSNDRGEGIGPFVFMNESGERLISGGRGALYTQSIIDTRLDRGTVSRYFSSSNEDDLIMALSDDGTMMAYYFSNNKEDDDSPSLSKIVILEWSDDGDEWKEIIHILPEQNHHNDIVKSLSFSSHYDGTTKLAVGIPNSGRVVIYEL